MKRTTKAKWLNLRCGLIGERFRGAARAREEGSALVEMAVVLPLLMLIVTGMISMGLVLTNYLMLSHATDVGARYLAVSRGQTTNPCSDTVTAIQNAAPGLSKSQLSYTFVIGSGTFSGGPTSFSGTSSSSCSVAGVTDLSPGKTATVTVSYPFQFFIYGWSNASVSIKSQTAEIIQ